MENNNELTPEKKEEKKSLWGKLFKGKTLRPNEVAVLYLRNNGTAEEHIQKPNTEGFFNFNDKVYHERSDCKYSLGKDRIPLAIIPEGSLLPLGTKEWDDKSMQEKMQICQDHAMKGIRYAERVKMGESGPMNPNIKYWVLGGIAALVVIAIVWQYIK